MAAFNQKEHEDLEAHLKFKLIKTAKKIKGEHLSISELVEGKAATLKVSKIYQLNQPLRHLFLMVAKHHHKPPKFRHFLMVSLASQSSDFLVILARELAIQKDLRLIQYSIFGHQNRTSLLCLKEVEKSAEVNHTIEILKKIRLRFREKLDALNDLIKNK